MDYRDLFFPFLITFFAGASTLLGGVIAMFAQRTNTRLLSFALGFSAGVMIYVSFVEILDKSRQYLILGLGLEMGQWVTVWGFFGGIALIAIIDYFVPESGNPHEMQMVEDRSFAGQHLALGTNNGFNQSLALTQAEQQKSLMRMGFISALAIALHNFPEGLATFAAALKDPKLGIQIGIAIAIHNIPEGIAVAIPVFYATGKRSKAFFYAGLSGLAEPVGAVIGFVLIMPFLNDTIFGLIFAVVAGIMVFISLDELLPSAQKYGYHHICIYGLILGMAVMAVSLVLF